MCSGQIIATKPPTVKSKGIPPPHPLNSGLGIILIAQMYGIITYIWLMFYGILVSLIYQSHGSYGVRLADDLCMC